MTSSCPAELAEFYREAVCGDQEAWEFLLAYHQQAHLVDDLVDGDVAVDAEMLLALTRAEQVVWGLAFYRRHERELQVASCLVRSLYGNSVSWEKAQHMGLRQMADTLRFAGNLMVEACALLTGGYEHQRRVSKILWGLSYHGHHDGEGNAE